MTTEALPTIDDFWSDIESAWSGIDDGGSRALLSTSPPASSSEREDAAVTLGRHIDTMLNNLKVTLSRYSSAQLSVWDAHCERALYDIDREDVHEALDGSDDGFLYARGFVVAAGRKHYELVKEDPETWGVMDAEAESMCYFASHLHRELYGDWPAKTGISRETCSNKEGWPSMG